MSTWDILGIVACVLLVAGFSYWMFFPHGGKPRY